MSVKPIDFQVMIPKTSDVAKIQQEMNEKSYIVQHQVAVKNQNDIQQSLKKVNSTEQSYKLSITQQQEKSKQHGSDKKKKQGEPKTSENEEGNVTKNNIEMKENKGSIIDISV